MDGDLKLKLQVAVWGGGGRWWNDKGPRKLFVYVMRRINLPGQQHHLCLIRRFRGIGIERTEL
jgi:hypothetical protein